MCKRGPPHANWAECGGGYKPVLVTPLLYTNRGGVTVHRRKLGDPLLAEVEGGMEKSFNLNFAKIEHHLLRKRTFMVF
jgi:hypothetical protein